uniref:Uncharacterized protein n=1 Tax=Rhizophora mucronata TaxID=61149 RepID=A0A2P2ITJ2_RHIMU
MAHAQACSILNERNIQKQVTNNLTFSDNLYITFLPN